MTYQEKVEFLNKFIALDAHIDALIKEKEKWFKRALIIGQENSDGQECDTNESTACLLLKVDKLEKQIDRKIDELVLLREKISLVIEGIENLTHQQIIYQKYICGKSLEKISEEIGYSTRQVMRIHKQAVEKMAL